MVGKGGFIYILTNKNNTTLYTGVTSDLTSRLMQHIDKTHPHSFSAKYNLIKLIYYEVFRSIGSAIDREKQIKAGSRIKKIELVESLNPNWDDLGEEVLEW